ncbi:hypothetical protein HK103_007228 [Boothiomyces macroporosus]|uniref:Uncharacterized protein n=1 Tax=Boothiomyces macroporosus TaxID=261099 RepID=A0AAD5UG56_9FUNG|nr:hypothetical protein HK103_007228 [Boothiomyces macroporosus]
MFKRPESKVDDLVAKQTRIAKVFEELSCLIVEESTSFSKWIENQGQHSDLSDHIFSLTSEVKDSLCELSDIYDERAANLKNLSISSAKVQNIVQDYENSFKMLAGSKNDENYEQYVRNEQELKVLSMNLPAKYEIQKNDTIANNFRILLEKWSEVGLKVLEINQ